VESNTWERRENLKNTQEAIEEFEKEYQQDMEDMARYVREPNSVLELSQLLFVQRLTKRTQ